MGHFIVTASPTKIKMTQTTEIEKEQKLKSRFRWIRKRLFSPAKLGVFDNMELWKTAKKIYHEQKKGIRRVYDELELEHPDLLTYSDGLTHGIITKGQFKHLVANTKEIREFLELRTKQEALKYRRSHHDIDYQISEIQKAQQKYHKLLKQKVRLEQDVKNFKTNIQKEIKDIWKECKKKYPDKGAEFDKLFRNKILINFELTKGKGKNGKK